MLNSFEIDESSIGERLDIFLAKKLSDHSRSQIQALIKDGMVKCNQKVVTLPRTSLKAGMLVEFETPDKVVVDALQEEPFDFEILFEDDSILVINKPINVVVHPGAGNQSGTIVNALLGRYPAWKELYAEENIRPGIVHRLDKDTSGCLVIAKNPEVQFKLSKTFAERSCEKFYYAIVHGVPKKNSGDISNLIGRHVVNRQKMAIVERNGKIAISQYKVKQSGLVDNIALSAVSVKILTGRTHQIRVHMASIGHPVLGDKLYGGAKGVHVNHQMLHAHTLRFPHPITGDDMTFFAPLPQDMQDLIARFEPLKVTMRKR